MVLLEAGENLIMSGGCYWVGSGDGRLSLTNRRLVFEPAIGWGSRFASFDFDLKLIRNLDMRRTEGYFRNDGFLAIEYPAEGKIYRYEFGVGNVNDWYQQVYYWVQLTKNPQPVQRVVEQKPPIIIPRGEPYIPWWVTLKKMEATMFEGFIRDFFEHQGYIVRSGGTSTYTADGGIDLDMVLKDNMGIEHRYLAQIKNWENPVGVAVIREFLYVMDREKIDGGFFVAPNISEPARKEAEPYKNLYFIEEEELQQFLETVQIPRPDDAQYCDQCGKSISSSSRFCRYCGAPQK